MLNFSGQVKRRNINLGSKNKSNTREDILLKAERERAKRAEERKMLNAALVIESSIRRHLTCKKLFSGGQPGELPPVLSGDTNLAYHLFPAYGARLLTYVDGVTLRGLLENSSKVLASYPGKLVNLQVTRTLQRLEDDFLVDYLLDALNMDYLDAESFIRDGLCNFLKGTKTLSDQNCSRICRVLQQLQVTEPATSDVIRPLYSLDCSEALLTANQNLDQPATSTIPTFSLLQRLASRSLYPGNTETLPMEQTEKLSEPVSTVEFLNLCYLLSNHRTPNRMMITALTNTITRINLQSDPITPTQLAAYQPYITTIYHSKVLLDNILGNVTATDEQRLDLTAIETLLQISELEPISQKHNLLVVMLTNVSFRQRIFDGLLSLEGTALYIATEMMNLYFMMVSDTELFYDGELGAVKGKGNTGLVSRETLCKFTERLKQFVFKELWEGKLLRDVDTVGVPNDGKSKFKVLDIAIDLLRRIYLRDSRVHFCSVQEVDKRIRSGNNNSNDVPRFWESRDEQFLKCNLYKLLDQFNEAYKERYNSLKLEGFSNIQKKMKGQPLKLEILNEKRDEWLRVNGQRAVRKLEILLRVPFFIPFEQRVDMFYTLVALDKQELNINNDINPWEFMILPWGPPASFNRQSSVISREHILEDAMKAYGNIGERFKTKLSVTFVNEFGPEEGIDGGGVTKEFLTSVSEEGFKDEKYGLFQTNEQYELYPRPTRDFPKLRMLEFMGKVVGKCLYDQVLIDVRFADFFLKKLLNYPQAFQCTFDDLNSLDSTLYSNLTKLLSMNEEELESLDLYFETPLVVQEPNSSGNNRITTDELIPGGRNVRVTKQNVLQYVLQVADYKLNKSLLEPTVWFHRGISELIAPIWIEMFNSVELQMLISGGTRAFDVTDLRTHTEYGGYEETDTTIRYFWELLNEMTVEQKCQFLKFVTSVPQAPLRGFVTLEPKFGIRNAGQDLSRLPTSSTCVNLLKLPDYRDKQLLREKLLYAINSGARFDLS